MSDFRVILSPYTAVELNKFNKMMYNKYTKEFLNDKLDLFCTVCGNKVFASESTSKNGVNLHCMNCHSFVTRLEEINKMKEGMNK